MLKIIRAGMYTTVQDGGRHGFRQSGISHCGALDMPALRIANLLVGNDANAPALEITLGQLTVEFETDGWFALTGAGCEARLDDNAVWTGWRLPMKAGQRLTLKRPQHGMRSYLAVAGGIDVPPVMGSCSTDLKVGIGGLEGRLLKDGDRLPIGKAKRDFMEAQGVKQLLWGNRIRALPGPEYHEFDRASQDAFWRSPWQLSSQSNRMGYRLQGQILKRTTDRELLSHGLLPGVVQVPHNGQPIVLMNDAQTTGGYPRIACIIEADMYHLAQIPLGQPIHFVQCSLEEALKARQDQQRYFEQLAWRLHNDSQHLTRYLQLHQMLYPMSSAHYTKDYPSQIRRSKHSAHQTGNSSLYLFSQTYHEYKYNLHGLPEFLPLSGKISYKALYSVR